MGVGGQYHNLATLYLWERALVPILEKAERAPVPVRTGMEKRKYLASKGVRTLDRSACSDAVRWQR